MVLIKVEKDGLPAVGRDWSRDSGAQPYTTDAAFEPRSGWPALFNTLRTHDSSKVEDCKDDINTLLVFAGLYSAVLTPFLVESYKLLQVDHQAVTARLTGQLITQNFTLGTRFVNSTTPIAPDHPLVINDWAVSVNVLWFLSLMVSLATASLGILVKGWLREYLALPLAPSKRMVIAGQRRRKALERWKVFEIAAILPLLLQVALALFFAGLCIFTANIHPSVRWSTISVVAAWAAFVAFTTLMPFFFPRCPYKVTFLIKASMRIHVHLWHIGRTIFYATPRSPSHRSPPPTSPSITSSIDPSSSVWGGMVTGLDLDEWATSNGPVDDVEILLSIDALASGDHLLSDMAFILQQPSVTFIRVVDFARRAIGRRLKSTRIADVKKNLDIIWDLSDLSEQAWFCITELVARTLLRDIDDLQDVELRDVKDPNAPDRQHCPRDTILDAVIILLSRSTHRPSSMAVRALQTFFEANTNTGDLSGGLLGARLAGYESLEFLSYSFGNTLHPQTFLPSLSSILDAYMQRIFPLTHYGNTSFPVLIQQHSEFHKQYKQILRAATPIASKRATGVYTVGLLPHLKSKSYSMTTIVEGQKTILEELYNTIIRLFRGALPHRTTGHSERHLSLFLVLRFGERHQARRSLLRSMCLDADYIGLSMAFFVPLHNHTRIPDSELFYDMFWTCTIQEQKAILLRLTTYCTEYRVEISGTELAVDSDTPPLDIVSLCRMLLETQQRGNSKSRHTVSAAEGQPETRNLLAKEWYELSEALSQSLDHYRLGEGWKASPVHLDWVLDPDYTWAAISAKTLAEESLDILLSNTVQDTEDLPIHSMTLISALRQFSPYFPPNFDVSIQQRRRRLIGQAIQSIISYDISLERYALDCLDVVNEDVLLMALDELRSKNSFIHATDVSHLLSRIIKRMSPDSPSEQRQSVDPAGHGPISNDGWNHILNFAFFDHPDSVPRPTWAAHVVARLLILGATDFDTTAAAVVFQDAFAFDRGLEFSARFEKACTIDHDPCPRCLLDVYWMILLSLAAKGRSAEDSREDDEYNFDDEIEEVTEKIVRLVRKYRTGDLGPSAAIKSTLRDLCRLWKGLLFRAIDTWRVEDLDAAHQGIQILLESVVSGIHEDEAEVMDTLATYYSFTGTAASKWPCSSYPSLALDRCFIRSYANMSAHDRQKLLYTSAALLISRLKEGADQSGLVLLNPVKICHLFLLAIGNGGEDKPEDYPADLQSAWRSVWGLCLRFLRCPGLGRERNSQHDQELACRSLELLRENNVLGSDAKENGIIANDDYQGLISALTASGPAGPPSDHSEGGRLKEATEPMYGPPANASPSNGRVILQ